MNPDELDEKLEQLYSSAQSASSEGLTEEALRRCEEALMLIENYGEDTEQHSYADFVMLMGDVHWTAGEYEDAYRAYSRVVQNEPERLDARVAMGVALYHLARFTASQTVLEMCSIDAPDDAETWYYLALLALRARKTGLAKKFFADAAELEEQRFRFPVGISDRDIRGMVQTLISDIPEPLREMLESVPIELEDQPSEELLYSSEPPMDPSIVGIFDGTAQGEDGPPGAVEIRRMIFFRDNIYLLANDKEKLEEELWTAIRNEIGHFLGLNEEELAERGLE